MAEQLVDLVVVEHTSTKSTEALVKDIQHLIGDDSPRTEFRLSEALLFNNGMASICEGLSIEQAQILGQQLATIGVICEARATLQLVAKEDEGETPSTAIYTCPACGHTQPKVKHNQQNKLDVCESCGIVGERYQQKQRKHQILKEETHKLEQSRSQRIRDVLEKAKLAEEAMMREEARRQLGITAKDNNLPKIIAGFLLIFIGIGALYYYNNKPVDPKEKDAKQATTETKEADKQEKPAIDTAKSEEALRKLSSQLANALPTNASAANDPENSVAFVDQVSTEKEKAETQARLTAALKDDTQKPITPQAIQEKKVREATTTEVIRAVEVEQVALPRLPISADEHAENRRRVKQLLRLDEMDLAESIIGKVTIPYARSLLLLDVVDWHLQNQRRDVALKFVERLNTELKQTKDVEQQVLIMGAISKAHLLLDEWDLAGNTLQQAIAVSHKVQPLPNQINLLARLANEQSLFGNQIAAHQIIEQASKIADKLPQDSQSETRSTVFSQIASSYAILTDFTEANKLISKIPDSTKRQKMVEFIDKLEHRVDQVRAELQQQSASMN